MTGDAALCNGGSDILENEFNKHKNTKGLGLAQLSCGQHGNNNCRNKAFIKHIQETDSITIWKGPSENWTERDEDQTKCKFSNLNLTRSVSPFITCDANIPSSLI